MKNTLETFLSDYKKLLSHSQESKKQTELLFKIVKKYICLINS